MTAITNCLDLDLLIEKDDDAYRARVSPSCRSSTRPTTGYRPPNSS